MNRLKALRKEKKLSQKELADCTGISYRTIQRLENGETEIKANKAQEIATFFDVPICYLLGYENKKGRASNEKDFILAIENMKIEILKNSDNLNSYELSNIKKHARDLYESLVWMQYEAEERK